MNKNKAQERELNLLIQRGNKPLPRFKKRVRMNETGKTLAGRSVSGPLFDNLIDVESVAEALGVAPKTIRKWVSIRFIPFVRVGRRVMFRPRSIELWLNHKEVKPCQ